MTHVILDLPWEDICTTPLTLGCKVTLSSFTNRCLTFDVVDKPQLFGKPHNGITCKRGLSTHHQWKYSRRNWSLMPRNCFTLPYLTLAQPWRWYPAMQTCKRELVWLCVKYLFSPPPCAELQPPHNAPPPFRMKLLQFHLCEWNLQSSPTQLLIYTLAKTITTYFWTFINATFNVCLLDSYMVLRLSSEKQTLDSFSWYSLKFNPSARHQKRRSHISF